MHIQKSYCVAKCFGGILSLKKLHSYNQRKIIWIFLHPSWPISWQNIVSLRKVFLHLYFWKFTLNIKKCLRGVCHKIFCLHFLWFKPIWAPDKQSKVFSNSVTILLRYSITKLKNSTLPCALGWVNFSEFEITVCGNCKMSTKKTKLTNF